MNEFSTDFLLGAYGVIERPRRFLLELFFPDEQTFDTEDVLFDKVDRARRLAPFVSPLVAGKPMKSQGYETKSFRPAYVKPKHVVEPGKALKRRAGEALTGEMDPRDRYEAQVLANLELEDDQIARREEWMASQILKTGKVIVEGEDFPKQEVDFGRNAAHSKALTSTARWGESGVSPFADLKGWGSTVAANSGFTPRMVILDPLAADLVMEDENLQKIMDNRRQSSGMLEFLGELTGAPGEEVAYLGAAGPFEFWQYQQLYTDEDGNVSKMMTDYSVIMGSPAGAQGTRLYGAIQDTKALRPLARFPKYWETDDPSVGFTMTQSAPLPVLGWVDATLFATVR